MKATYFQVFRVTAVIAVFLLSILRAPAQNTAATYKAKCAMCHGADGKGDTAAGKSMGAHSFASPEVQKMTDTDLESIIAKGKGKMPGYGTKLKEAEIKDLVAYIRELGKGK